MSKYDDEIWLTSNMPLATENEVEKFCERVAICVQDFEFDEKQAREFALALLRNKK
jgi:hypothetical protein